MKIKKMKKKKILISTYPFCDNSDLPKLLLKKNKINYTLNPKNRRLTEKEIFKYIKDYDGLIADTEPLTKKVLKNARKLKFISRVGIGLNSVDLNYARSKKIRVAYTPDAPTDAVVELTIGLIFDCIRKISEQNTRVKKKKWIRQTGFRIPFLKFGILGFGRIGSKVAKNLSLLGAKKIYYNDLKKKKTNFIFKSKDFIYKNCDVILLHLPLTLKTLNLINTKELNKMKHDSILINTARGEILNEDALYAALKKGKFFSVALDVFENEPYRGKLRNFDRCILTPHIGSMSNDCRKKMELEATKSIINYFNKKKISNLVI